MFCWASDQGRYGDTCQSNTPVQRTCDLIDNIRSSTHIGPLSSQKSSSPACLETCLGLAEYVKDRVSITYRSFSSFNLFRPDILRRLSPSVARTPPTTRFRHLFVLRRRFVFLNTSEDRWRTSLGSHRSHLAPHTQSTHATHNVHMFCNKADFD